MQPVTAPEDYDAAPYAGRPYDFTHPNRLAAVAALAGVDAPPLETARVVEFGCATGENLIPIAARFPRMELVGIDFSPAQIDAARAAAAAADVANVRFEAASIMDLDAGYGEFDYAIAHGFYSWTPPDVRARMLELAASWLAPAGVAFVSFNALPGWSSVAPVRDLMRFHARGAATQAERIRRARAALDAFAEHAAKRRTPYYAAMLQEIELLRGLDDSHVLHDHLETSHEPFLLHDVVAAAGAAGLAFLGSADVELMLAAPEGCEGSDLADWIQERDFLGNRRFHRAVFGKAGAAADALTRTQRLDRLHVAALVAVPDGVASDTPPPSFQASGRSVPLSSALERGFWRALARAAGGSVEARALIDATGAPPEAARRCILEAAAAGLVCLIREPIATGKAGERPAALADVRRQAREFGWAANALHRATQLPPALAELVGALDGARDADALREVLRAYRRKSRGGAALTAQDERDVDAFLADGLRVCARQGFLIP